MLKNVYGEVIIPKDSILYHTTDEDYNANKRTPFLFCTFHPSDWTGFLNDYVLRVKLKRDIKVLFMIKDFRKAQINSSLNELSNNREYLSKLNNNKKICFRDNLLKEDFDGWLSSIENRTSIEVALINNKDIYEIISKEELRMNWRNGNNANNIITTKNWGKLYKISTIEKPLIMNLNNRIKKKLDEYIRYGINSKFPNEYVFQVVLQNAIINYHNHTFQKIDWFC